jgi:hypothetical protein
MSKLTRRAFLSGTATATVLVAGCVDGGAGDGGTNTPTGTGTDTGTGDVPALTGYAVSDATVRPSAERPDDEATWGLYLAGRDAAEAYFGDPEESSETDAEAVRSFVAGTDFDAGDRLLYVASYGPQTCYELVLDGDPRVGEAGLPRVDARVERTAPDDQACGEAITPVALLLRLSFAPDPGPPEAVEVHVVDGWEKDVSLRLEAEQ